MRKTTCRFVGHGRDVLRQEVNISAERACGGVPWVQGSERIIFGSIVVFVQDSTVRRCSCGLGPVRGGSSCTLLGVGSIGYRD